MFHQREASENGPRRALILAGGGVRVAYQTGVLWALEEAGMSFQHVDGTSGGIFNTAMLASGCGLQDMMKRWRSLPMSFFSAGRPFGEYMRPFRMWGLSDGAGIRKKVFPHLGIDISTIRTGGFPANFNLCNFTTKQIEAIPAREINEDHLIAGVSLPMFMPALQINGRWYMDAAWVKDANLLEEVRLGATELWVIWAIGNYQTYMRGTFNQYVHSLEMSANGGLFEEFEQIKLINRIRELEGRPEWEQVKLHVITSEFPLPLDTELFLQKITARDLINQGYADAKRYLLQQTANGVPLENIVTRTKDIGDSCTFRGKYTGMLVWDGLLSPIELYTFFRINGKDRERISVDLFSSINFSKLELEIPIFTKEVSVETSISQTRIKARGELIRSGITYLVFIDWEIYSPWYQILGLDYKEITIRVCRSADSSGKPVMTGNLGQSFWNRIKASFLTSSQRNDGMPGGLKTRRNLLKKMMQI
jgi:predicted acylesterase/phospholipase RssA